MNTANHKEEKTSARLLTQEQERYAQELEAMGGQPHAKELAKQFRKGNIEATTFKQARELLRDPNKMKDDSYKNFIKALAKGKFPNKAKSAPHFLKALSGSEKERAYAKEVITDISLDTSGPLSKRLEKAHLKELTDLRQEEVAQKTVSQTSATVGTITTSADLHSRLAMAAETSELLEGNWQLEKFDSKQAKKTTALMKKRKGVQEEYVQTFAELREEQSKDPVDEVAVKRLQKKLRDLDAKNEEIQKEYQKENAAALAYIERNAKRNEKIRELETLETGIPLNKKGVVIKVKVPDKDGKTDESKEERIFIKEGGISFDTDRTDLEEVATGSIRIVTVHENGQEEEPRNATNLASYLNAYGAYEDIPDLKQLNAEISEQTGETDLEEGMEFEIKEPIDDEFDSEKRQSKKIRIEKIDKENGKIILDKAVIATPREWISLSVHPNMYVDRIQREFTYGQFAKLLKQHQYQTDISTKRLDKLLEDKDFKPLEDGEKRKIWYLDETGKRREGYLSKEDGEYHLEQADIRRTDYPDYEKLIQAGVPLHIAAAHQAKTLEKDHQNKTWKRKKLGTRNLLDMANKGNMAATTTEDEDLQDPGTDAGTDLGSTDTSRPSSSSHSSSKTSGSSNEEEKDSKRGKVPVTHDEALDYSEIYKTGGMETKERSILREMWTNTRFLSGNDIWEMGKAMWEYYERRWQRRQKERYSSIGTDIPFFAPEMKRIHQAAENEEVNQFKETFEQFGVFQIQERLKKTRNRDEMKAAIMVLSDKGQLRWDDIDFWKNLNKFVDASVAIPIPSNGDPNTRVSDKDDRTGFDFIAGAIDSLWGEGTYNGWFNKNKGSYQSNAKGYYEEGNQLEGVDGGHGRRLATLLADHKRGNFVDPHEYEGLILHAIERGKAGMQQKIYYMIEGVAAVNMHGRTILPFDRMAHINSEMLTRFPLLEYLCASVKRPDGKTHRFTIDDYKRWVKDWDEGQVMNPDKCRPGKKVDEFMWKYILPSDETQNRINKVLRNGEMLDHDDMFAYLPPATESVITDATKSTTGSKKFLTVEGYANGFPGFSQYLRSQAENDNREKLREGIKSYVRFEGIITDRFEKADKGYQRFDWSTLNSGTINTPDRPPQLFIDQMNKVVGQIVEAYGDPKLIEIYGLLRQKTGNIQLHKEEMDKQKRIDQAFKEFGTLFTNVVKSDNGEKMVKITESANLEGLPFGVSDEERAMRKAAYKDSMELG
ncbi:MAG: hypothetical protein O3B47_00355 [bacterium]|nr:hypothetical protein [bacterium]